jgi:hypothetical protein
MTIETQNRPSLAGAVQQAAAATLASIVALQIATFLAADSLPAEKDLAICDASAGAFNLALPSSSEAIVGKPYVVKEIEGTNAVTLTTPGSETIDGGATFVVAAGTSACVVWDGTTWHSVANAGSGGSGFLVDGAGTVDATNLATDSVTTVKIADNAVTPAKVYVAEVDVAQDAAFEITRNHHLALIRLDTTTGAKGITTDTAGAGAVESGQIVTFYVDAATGGSYTLAVTGGTLTLDAANERATVQRVGSAWVHLSLVGATVV